MKSLKVLLVLGMLVSCNSFNRIDSVFISNSTAELFIQNQNINSLHEANIGANQDSVYRIISLAPENDKTTFEFFIRRNLDFYVIQNSEIIYQNTGIQFYPIIEASNDAHLFYPDENKTLYQIELATLDIIHILIKQSVKHELKAVFEIAELNDLYLTKSQKSLPWIDLNTSHGISDASYSEVDVSQRAILLNWKIKIRGSSSKAFPKKQQVFKRKTQLFQKNWFFKRKTKLFQKQTSF